MSWLTGAGVVRNTRAGGFAGALVTGRIHACVREKVLYCQRANTADVFGRTGRSRTFMSTLQP